MKKLIEQLQTTTLPETLREVYVPERLTSFDEALLYARRRQRARRRALIANASLLVLFGLFYLYWSSAGVAPLQTPKLQPVPPNEIAKEPPKKSNIGAPSMPSSTQTSTTLPTSAPTSAPSKKKTAPASQPGSLPAERP